MLESLGINSVLLQYSAKLLDKSGENLKSEVFGRVKGVREHQLNGDGRIRSTLFEEQRSESRE